MDWYSASVSSLLQKTSLHNMDPAKDSWTLEYRLFSGSNDCQPWAVSPAAEGTTEFTHATSWHPCNRTIFANHEVITLCFPLALPEKYNGPLGKCKGFWMQCAILVISVHMHFSRDIDKICQVLILHTGNTYRTYGLPLCSTPQC